MKKLIVLFAVLSAVLCMRAQEDVRHWMGGLTFGVNNDGWEWGLDFTWYPVESFGVKASIGMAGERMEFDDWEYEDWTDKYAWRFKFSPSIELRSPALILWNSEQNSLHLFANPGLVLSPGATGSRDAKWLCYQLRGGIEFIFSENIVLQLGYSYSNFSLYSGYPYSYYGYDDPDHPTHTGFVTIAYRF